MRKSGRGQAHANGVMLPLRDRARQLRYPARFLWVPSPSPSAPARAGTTYPIRIGRGLASSLALAGRPGGGGSPIVVLEPAGVGAVGPRVRRAGRGRAVVLVPDGERAKHLRTVTRVHDALLDARRRSQDASS